MRLLQALALLTAGMVPVAVQAQVAPTTTRSAAEEARLLQRFDKNNNGVLDGDEVTAMRAETGSAAAGTAPVTTSAASGDEVVEMSPFTVTSEKDVGYYAENTLAGSRLKTNLADLAASITVVTKQQLEDTGALDINDVFMYEASTEGANTYTPISINRSNITDQIGGWSGDEGGTFNATTANRVRGLGSADTAQNNYPTIKRIPFDAYNTNNVEISRGPNSMLFGTGSPAGIVNQATSEAAIGRQHTTVSARFGSFDSYRASISTNVPIGDRFAIFAAALYDDRQFQRKPSSDVYRRQYIAGTFRPAKGTKITASYEHYDNFNNRPNSLPAQDYVTPWLSAGRPGWNPVTKTITFQDTGRQIGPYYASTRDPRYVSGVTPLLGDMTNTQSPFFVQGIGLQTRNSIRYDQGQIQSFWVGTTTAGGNTNTGLPAEASRTIAQWDAINQYTGSLPAPSPRPPASSGATEYGIWLPPHVTNQSIYNWEEYNLLGANYARQNAYTYNVELQQQIFQNNLHGMHLSAGWFRQEMEERTFYGLGQANQAPRLYVDTNTHLLNGQVNPYFGSPYVIDWQADSFYRPETNDNLRAMLSYEIDLTQQKGWMKWIGRHRFLGLVSQQDQWQNNLRYRLSSDSGDPRFLPNQNPAVPNNFSWGINSANIQRIYYVGNNANGQVDHGLSVVRAPGDGGPDRATLNYFDWPSMSFRRDQIGFHHNLIYAGGGYGVSTRKTTSKSFAWQGWLWNERILPTFGWRTDALKLQAYNGRKPDGTFFSTPEQYTAGFGNPGLWNYLGDSTYFEGDTITRGGVVRPFKGWRKIEEGAANGSFVHSALRSLSFHYNESDNFNAPSGVQVDFFNKRLPPPSGKGKDYGVGMSLFNDKLVLRLNWFESSNEYASSAVANTVVGRAARIDTSGAHRWAEYVVRMRHGQDPRTDLDFHNNTVNPLTPQMETEIAQLQFGNFALGDFYWPRYDGTIAATESNVSKGKELTATYNPTRAWTMKLTVSQTKASFSNAGKEVQDWLNYRKPQWMAMVAPDIPGEMTKANGNKLRLDSFWTGYGFTQGAPFDDAPSDTTGMRGTMSSTFTSIVEADYFTMKAKEGTLSPGLREWNVTYLTSYTFQSGFLKGLGIGGSYRWQDKATAGYYGLLDPSTYARPSATQVKVVMNDLNRPIYVPSEDSVDLWASYSTKLTDKIRMKIQLNVRDAFEKGGLQVVGFNMDGSPAQYRIKEPRVWFVTTTFDF